MDTEHSTAFDTITDIEVLRSYLRDTTQSLHSAAQMGISLAQQNQALQTRLSELTQDHQDLHQRLTLIEHDRKWLQQQSLRVDQLRVTLNELQSKHERAERRMASDQRVSSVQSALDVLREDFDLLARTVEEERRSRRKDSDMASVTKSVSTNKAAINHLRAQIGELSEIVDMGEAKNKANSTETQRALAEIGQRFGRLEGDQQEAQRNIHDVAEHQGKIEQSLESVIVEYNTMLNEHEQAIRILGESQSVLESQLPAGRLGYTLQDTLARASSRPRNTGRGGRATSAQPAGSRNGAAVAFAPPAFPIKGGESLDDIFAADEGVAMLPARADAGLPLSPPLSTTSAEITSISALPAMAHTRKAASVIGTPGDRPKQRTRPRMSSFSRLASPASSAPSMSPTRMAGFGNIISTTAHVGVGWGNYWQARRHRLQFDIQRRLGLSASASAVVSSSVKPESAEDELGIED
ncbi:hypothetical protein GGI15_003387 [Coemansia interrupta]|uniref:Uncharacterized protein n=1 Tax=Coemansia interrupta TaxID=1126814 RepID=A0A9W8LI23_9FUNG|nr:hypothetical protein GGI15_003387 [Coemansia interrupta]